LLLDVDARERSAAARGAAPPREREARIVSPGRRSRPNVRLSRARRGRIAKASSSRARPGPAQAPLRRDLKKLLLVAVVFAVGLGLAEIGFRVWMRATRPITFDAALIREEFLRAAAPTQPFVARIGTHIPVNVDGNPIGVLHPYCGSEYEHDLGGVLSHFREGIPADEYTVVIVGGSVATLFATGACTELEQLLSQDPHLAGRRVRVLAYAHPAYKQPQQVMRLAYLFSLGYRPDAVINIDGFNEVALAVDNASMGSNPVYPSFPIWGFLVQDFGAQDPELIDQTLDMWQLREEVRDIAATAVHWRIYESSLVSYAVLHRMRTLMKRRNDVQREVHLAAVDPFKNPRTFRQVNGPDFDHEPSKVLDLCLTNWTESSRSIRAMCQRRGVAYLHVIQPTLNDPGSKPLTPAERALPPLSDQWKPAVVAGYPLLRQRAEELRRGGETILDATQVFASTTETLYFDACHFNEAGDRILARFIAPYFREHVLAQSVAEAAVEVGASPAGHR
jgi:hypothetical protein